MSNLTFPKNHQGSAIVEYGIILALVGLVCVSQLGSFGDEMNAQYDNLSGFLADGVEGGGAGTAVTNGANNGTTGTTPTDLTTGQGNASAFQNLANYSPQDLGSMIEVGGANGTVNNLYQRLQQIAQEIQADNPQEAADLMALAQKGFKISTQINAMNNQITTIQHSSQNNRLTIDPSNMPDMSVLSSDIQNFEAQRSQTLAKLASTMPSLNGAIDTLAGDITSTATEFNQFVDTNIYTDDIQMWLDMGGDAVSASFEDTTAFQNLNNMNQLIAGEVVQTKSEKIASYQQ